jgi:hypothetical protein
LTSSQRAEAERAKAEIVLALSIEGEAQRQGRAAILWQMIRASGGTAPSEATLSAKAAAYLDAVGDQPAWALQEAVRRWNRGECGDHNYNFAPAPAVLRRVVEDVLAPYHAALVKVETALTAVSHDRAMDSTPIEREKSLVPTLRAV